MLNINQYHAISVRVTVESNRIAPDFTETWLGRLHVKLHV